MAAVPAVHDGNDDNRGGERGRRPGERIAVGVGCVEVLMA